MDHSTDASVKNQTMEVRSGKIDQNQIGIDNSINSIDDNIISVIESLSIEIDDFKSDNYFEKSLILNDGSDYYVCGRLYLIDSNLTDKITKLQLDIKLNHPMIPSLYGFNTGNSPSIFLEIRKIHFEPLELTKEIVSKATRNQLLKIISQFLDFTNFINNQHYSMSLLTFEDFFACCFIDSSFNLYFGNLCFIEVYGFPHKNLYSAGIIIYQLLGGEITINENQTIQKPVFSPDFPEFWEKFICSCWIDDVDSRSFHSPFMKKIKKRIYFPLDKPDESLKLDFDEDQLEEAKINKKEIEEYIISDSEAREIVNKYQSYRYIPASGKKSDKFSGFQTTIKEDGSLIFDIKIKKESIEEAVSMLVTQIEVQHPMVLPLTGFSCNESTLKTFHFYKETSFPFKSFSRSDLYEASFDQKVKWMKQLSDFTVYLIENTNYKIVECEIDRKAAFDQSNNFVFINTDFLQRCSKDEDIGESNAEGFWDIINHFFNCYYPPPSGLSSRVKQFLDKLCIKKDYGDNYVDFCKFKTFLDNYDPSFISMISEVAKYLEDYSIEQNIEGHKCHVTIFKRKLMSNKKFKRLVFKKYNYVFSDILMKNIKNNFSIYEMWTTDRESFILMPYIKASRLKDLIPSLNYEQKISILTDICRKIYIDRSFGILSIDNIYVTKDLFVEFLDCIFIIEDIDDPHLCPDIKILSTLNNKQKYSVNVFSFGIIAYEMFGGSFEQSKGFNFEGIPPFIENLIRICCKKEIIDRVKYFALNDILEQYQDPDIDKLFQKYQFDVSPYYIEESDIHKPLIGSIENCVTQKSTNKVLYAENLVAIQFDDSISYGTTCIDLMRSRIQASRCRNCLPICGFTINESNSHYTYLYEFVNIIIDLKSEAYMSLNRDVKLEVIKNISEFVSDMQKEDMIINVKLLKIVFDRNNQVKILPSFRSQKSIQNDSVFKCEIFNFAELMVNSFNNNKGINEIGKDTPLIIQALVNRMIIGDFKKRANYHMIEKVFCGMEKTLTSNIQIEWEKSQGFVNNGDEYLIYKSTKNPDLIEEGIRTEILMESSNLISYSRKDYCFALIYQGKCDSTFIDELYELENFTIIGRKARKRIKKYKVESEYKGSHCLVQFLSQRFKKLILKKYYKNYGNLDFFSKKEEIKSVAWEEENMTCVIQEFKNFEPLENQISILDQNIKTKMIKEILEKDKYYRLSPHNIGTRNKKKDLLIVDNISIRSNTYNDFRDEFTAPECSRFPELREDEIMNMTVYSVGWIAYVLFGQKPEIDPATKRFKAPTFPNDFPQFWKDFISLSTIENSLDRPLRSYLINKIQTQSPFEEVDYVKVSSKLLNHDDYSIENPIGAGGEAIVFLVTNKLTDEKHACKKIKHSIRSIEIKKMLLAIEKLDISIYGIKYIGISMNDEDVFLHMEYVPNGSLSETISLDRRMRPPSWFNESTKLRISREIAEGMQSLHEHGIVHKDLKPENILIDSNFSVKIIDFSFIPEEGAATPLFMAPELINGEEATEKSDVYSFAVTLACIFGGGEMIGSVKKAAIGGFRPSISVSTPPVIQGIIRKCWKQSPEERPTFVEVIADLEKTDFDEDDLRVKSMDEYPEFDLSKEKGVLSEEYEYEICNIVDDAENTEHFVRLHMTIQPENMLQIHKYCRIDDKIVLILEKSDVLQFDVYLSQKKKVSVMRGEKYVNDFISIFELYHKNGFCFGPFSLRRLFFRGKHLSSLCFDLFQIPGLVRPQSNYEREDILISPPEGAYSCESDVFSFACFIQKIFNCLSIDSEGKVSSQPFKGSGLKSKSKIPPKYRNVIMARCLNDDPKSRPTFELLFQKLFPVQYRIISNFLSVSVSRFSTFSMNKDFRQEDIEFLEILGQGTYGKVVHAFNKASNQDLAVKEFNDIDGRKNDDFMLEYVALKAIDHPNIVKIVGASQRKESHGSRLFMEFAGGGDLRKNMNEPFEWFVVHLLQISSAMKYLHQRDIVHLDLKPENILIRDDGSAVVADFNTAMHVDIDTHLRNQRGSMSYMSPEILRGDKYSFSTDVFSFGLIAAEYFSSESISIVRESNNNHKRPNLNFIEDKRMRALLEFCLSDDPMSRPSFDLICNYLFNNFIQNTSRAKELENITQVPRINDEKLNQLRVIASRGSSEAILEYAKYLLFENSFADAIYVLLKGANDGDARCQNILGVISKTKLAEGIIKDSDDLIKEAANNGDKLAMTNYGYKLIKDRDRINESIELLSKAYSKGVTHAGYLLGLVYEKHEIEGMKFEERIKKAVELYREAAKEGDSFAQYKFGNCLEEGFATDEDGLDCIHYYRQSAYQRCKQGVEKYCNYLEGEEKEYYNSINKILPNCETYYLMEYEQSFFDEMMSCHTGMELFDIQSNDRFEFLINNFFKNIFI